jgi:glycosyltransferase involved in cell wall biosynthesis
MIRSVSAIVPVYNERQAIGPAVEAIDQFLRATFADYEILLIESGSTDGTADECDRIAATHPRAVVIHEGARRGFGSALKVAFRRAGKDLLWVVTVDLPFPLESISAALPLLARYDCVLSYRSADPRSRSRRMQSAVYNALVRSILRLPMRHVNSAFKVLKRGIAGSITPRADGWFFDAELLYRIHQQGVSWTEIPVPLIDRQTGRGSVGPWTFISVLKELVAFVMAERG